MYFLTFDSKGQVTGNGVSNTDEIPDDAIACTQEQYADAHSYAVSNGAIVAAPDAVLLAQAQTAQIAQLSAACQAAIYGGFQSGALGAPHTYPSGDNDQRNLNACVTASMLPSLPAGWSVPFWCADSSGNWSFAPHTAAQIQQAGADGMMAIQAAQARNAALAAKVSAATTVAAVRAITWESTP